MDPFKTFHNVLSTYVSEKCLQELPVRWSEPHRLYHNVDHLTDILHTIEKNISFKELSAAEKHMLLLSAFFHDIVYDPTKTNNEDMSIKYFLHYYTSSNLSIRDNVVKLIETTKHRKRPLKKLERIFWDADNDGFKRGFEYSKLVEQKIRKEFKHVPKDKYKKARIDFLKSCTGLFGTNVDKDLIKMVEYVEKIYK